MVWLLLCKEYKLHMGNRLIDSLFFPQVEYTESLKERNWWRWSEGKFSCSFLCVLSKFSYKHISFIYIIFLNAIFIWEIQIFSWGRYLKKPKTQLGKVIKGVYLSKIMRIFWSLQSFVVTRMLHIMLSVFVHPTSFSIRNRHSSIPFCPSPSAVFVGGCSETCKEPMGKLLIARSGQ